MFYCSIASNKAFIEWWLWFQTWFRDRSIITIYPERPSSNSRYHQTVWLTSLYGIAISTLMQFELYLRSFYVFLLVWWRKFKISQEYGGRVGNETLSSDLDRKYIGYPVISDTLFSQILIFFQLTLMNPIEIFFKRDR